MTSKKITMTTADDANGPPVTMFKSLAVALKDLEPYIRNGRHLQVGDEFKEFGGLRSRELLGNWLLCVVGNSAGIGTPSRAILSEEMGLLSIRRRNCACRRSTCLSRGRIQGLRRVAARTWAN